MTLANPVWTTAVSISVFLFFSLMLAVPSGYSYGAALLFFISLCFLAQHRVKLSAEDKVLIYTLLSVFMAALLSFAVHGSKLNALDQSSRCLLAIPVAILLINVPPRPTYVWAGLVTGTIGAACITIWQIYWLGMERATGFVTSAVPFGNLALMMGLLCAIGIFWMSGGHRKAQKWRVALSIGTLAGLYCSVASATRGGWVAIGPVVLLLCIAFLNKKNMRRAFVAGALFLITLSTLFAIPESTVRLRYDEAINEIANYAELRDATTSIGARLEAWHAAALSIPKKPILGWSESEYRTEMEGLVARERLDPFVLTLANSHNNFIEVWLFQGLPGLLALLALYALPFYFFCKRLRTDDNTVKVWAVSGASLLTSFFIFSLTLVILGRNNGITFFVIALAICWGSMRAYEMKSAKSMQRGKTHSCVPPKKGP
ncbi:O-antigen ligase family protein [Parapusillimonas sp. SGNA-6]|nr:O-antigen ligase family protein [Parapusillimonas sp. SGNA-6]